MKKRVFNALVTAGVLFCVYTTGKIIGHMDCLQGIMHRYGNDISSEEITSNVTKNITITLHKQEKA